jgi:3-oxoacyl-[acyl-carrier protein] reductase
MVQQAVDDWGRLDYLVNSAGTTRRCAHDDLEGASAEDFHDIYDVNVVGVFQMVRAAAPHLSATGAGMVVNVSACGGFDGKGSSIAYAASKGALNTMTLSLARALAPDVRVNAVAPNLIDGRWVRAMMGEDAGAAHIAATAEKHPLSRVNSPDDVAAAVLWLATVATTMTGEIIRLDAGHHLT